jgi:hypothetical protein
MGRPPVLPKKKKDGFYLELRNKGAKSGIIVIRDTKEAMMQAARQYENTKDVSSWVSIKSKGRGSGSRKAYNAFSSSNKFSIF